MRYYWLALLLLLALILNMAYAHSPLPAFASRNTYPIALSKSNGYVYALYSDGSLYRLEEDEAVLVAKIPLPEDVVNLSSYVVDFTVTSHIVYINLYRSTSKRSGENIVLAYDLGKGKYLLNKKFSFNITDKGLKGVLVVSIVPYYNYLGVILVDSKHGPLIRVYVFGNDSYSVLSYNATLAVLVYAYNNSLIAPIPSRVEYGGSILNAGLVVDLVGNKTMFTLPSIAPILRVAKLVVQPYRVKDEWVAYVTVIGGLINNTEFYLVKPNDIRLKEYYRVVVDPYLRFAVISYRNNISSILFSDGTVVNISHQLSIIPQNYYFYNEPISGVLDVDEDGHQVLYRVIEKNHVKIMLARSNGEVEVASTNISSGLKIHGFYAYVNDNRVYILNPTTHEVEIISIGKPRQEDKRGTLYLLLLVVALVVVLALVSKAISKRMFSK